MLRFLPLFFLAGCAPSRPPLLSDTRLDEISRNWAEVYRMEIKIAVDNEDLDAYNFFFEEYMKLRVNQIRENPK